MQGHPRRKAPETCVLQSGLRANGMKSHRDGRRGTTHLSHRAMPARYNPARYSRQCEWPETCGWHSGVDRADNSMEQPPRSLRPTLSSSPVDGVLARGQWRAQFVEKTVLRRTEKSRPPTVL